MALDDPEGLIAFAADLGYTIGSRKERPTILLQRLLQLADGFYEQPPGLSS